MPSIKKNYFYNSIYQIMMLVVPLITTPYLTRTIGADGIGTYSYNYTVTNYFAMFVLLGLENYGNREIAKHKNSGEELCYTFSSIYGLQLCMGVIVTVVYGLYIAISKQNHVYALIFGINVIAACLDINWCLYGMELFQAIAVRNVVIKALTTSAIFLLIRDQSDVVLYCLIMLFSNLITQVSAWPIVLQKIKPVRPQIKHILDHLVPNLWLFLTVISVSLYKSVDKLMLGIMDPQKTQVGFYELAERIIAIPNMLVVSLGTVMMPRVTNMISKKEKNYTDLILPSLFFAMLLSTSMCFGIMGVSQEFVPLFCGDGFDLCIALYLILLPCSLFMAFANVIRTQYILPNTMDKTLLMSGVFGNILNIFVNILLIPQFGAIGAAIGTLAAEIMVCLYQSFCVRTALPLKQYLKYISPLVAIGLVMFSVIFNFDITGRTDSLLIGLMAKVIIGAVIYLVGLAIYIVILRKRDEKESQHIMRFLSQFLSRDNH